MISTLVNKNSIVLMIDGKTFVVTNTHLNYEQIKAKVIQKDYDGIEELIDVKESINKFGSGKVVVRGNEIFYGDEVLHNAMNQRIFAMIEEGFDVNPMVLFLENLMQNPSKRAVDELYGFLEACNLPITDDGHFLAYKKVRRNDSGNLVDIYTGKFNNNVGQIPEVRRNQVDEDKNRTCSYGLHFCSQSYLPHFGAGSGDVVVVVKINPADVVAIPVDYKNAKGRTCKYEVMSEHKLSDYNFPSSVVSGSWDEDSYDEYDDYDSDEDDRTYDAGYDAGKAKALRHNARGWGSIEYRYETDWDTGYADGYEDHIDDIPETKGDLKSPPKKSFTALRDPATGRYVSKAAAPVAPATTEPTTAPVRAFVKNPTTGLLEVAPEAAKPTGPHRDPKTGRYLPKA